MKRMIIVLAIVVMLLAVTAGPAMAVPGPGGIAGAHGGGPVFGPWVAENAPVAEHITGFLSGHLF